MSFFEIRREIMALEHQSNVLQKTLLLRVEGARQSFEIAPFTSRSSEDEDLVIHLGNGGDPNPFIVNL
jgi:hypothetical protein